jgi:hypothetical protein
MEHLQMLKSLLVSHDPRVTEQGMELLVAQEPTADDLSEVVTPLLRASNARRNVAAMQVISRFLAEGAHSEAIESLRQVAVRLIYDKLGGTRRATVERGLALLDTLDCPVSSLEVWKHLVGEDPGCLSIDFRDQILDHLDARVDSTETLDCEHVDLYTLLGRAVSQKDCPPLLKRMPRLAEIDFQHAPIGMPGWLHELPSIRYLDLGKRAWGALTEADLPPALTELLLQESPVKSVKLSMPSLKLLDLSRCRGLVELDLVGCDNLECLLLPGAWSLRQLPDTIVALPALVELDISQCRQLETPWPERWSRPGLTIRCDRQMQRERERPLRLPSPADTPKERAAALASIKVRLSSTRDGAFRAGVAAWEQLPEAEQVGLRKSAARSLQRRMQHHSSDKRSILAMLDDHLTPELAEKLWGMGLFTLEGRLPAFLNKIELPLRRAIIQRLLLGLPDTVRSQVATMHSHDLDDFSILPKLTGLKQLTLARGPSNVPDLSTLVSLESLELQGSRLWSSLPAGIGALPSLRLLRIVDGQRLRRDQAPVFAALLARGVELDITQAGTRSRLEAMLAAH